MLDNHLTTRKNRSLIVHTSLKSIQITFYLYLYKRWCVFIYGWKKIKKYVWEANMRFRIVFLGGVYPPFKRLNANFLPVLGHFWAFLVFLFTCVAVSPLHYMYNVMQQNGCFPLLVRFSGVFAILPVIIPSLSFLSLFL